MSLDASLRWHDKKQGMTKQAASKLLVLGVSRLTALVDKYRSFTNYM